MRCSRRVRVWGLWAALAASPGAWAQEAAPTHADALEATGAALEAAAAWEAEALRGRDDEALLRAARLWARDEGSARGEQLLALWLARHGDDPRAPRVALERARLLARRLARHDSAGTRRVAITHYEHLAQRYGERDPALVVLALVAAGRLVPPDARPSERVLALQLHWAAVYQWHLLPRSLAADPAVREAAAGAAFELAQASVRRALSPSLDEALEEAGEVDAPRLFRIIADRLSWLETARPKLHKVVDYGDPTWAVAAVVREGQLFEAFAERLSALSPPPGWTRAQLDALRPELNAQADDLRDRAIALYEAALRHALNHEVVGPWSLDAAAALVRLRPDAYPLAVRREAAPRLPDGLPGTGFVTRPRPR